MNFHGCKSRIRRSHCESTPVELSSSTSQYQPEIVQSEAGGEEKVEKLNDKFSQQEQRPRGEKFPAFYTMITIPEFYNNRDVFITGATGFVGKVLIEKLLRSCPGIRRIFLMLRPKRTRTIAARVEEIKNTPVSYCCAECSLLKQSCKVFLFFCNRFVFETM